MRNANSSSGENPPCQTYVGINPLNALIFGCDILTDLIIKYLQTILIKDHIMQDYLQESNVKNVDIFLALSADDHTNVLLAQSAKHLFDVQTVICRIEDPELNEIYSELDLKVIGKADRQLYLETTNLIEG